MARSASTRQLSLDLPPPEGVARRVPVDELLLDPENPRLASLLAVGPKPNQDELVEQLWSEMAVDELALSIAANGYFAGEPLLVIERDGEGSGPPFLVLEGNRRLAAVRILLDPVLRNKVKATHLPTPASEIYESIRILPAIVYPSRQQIWSYLGFRHINGSKPWDAFSKAEYIELVHDRYGIPLQEIARKIGDQHSTVRRLFRGLKVLRQAEQQADFSRDDISRNRFYFSHLYTALDQPEFQRHLGITADGSLKSDPVPHTKLSNLKDLMIWIYGRRSTKTEPLVRTQFPDLNDLRDVIANPKSVAALRSGLSLQIAHEISVGDERRLQDSLTRAEEELRRAKGSIVQGFNGQADLLELVRNIVRVAQSIESEMQSTMERRGSRARSSNERA